MTRPAVPRGCVLSICIVFPSGRGSEGPSSNAAILVSPDGDGFIIDHRTHSFAAWTTIGPAHDLRCGLTRPNSILADVPHQRDYPMLFCRKISD